MERFYALEPVSGGGGGGGAALWLRLEQRIGVAAAAADKCVEKSGIFYRFR